MQMHDLPQGAPVLELAGDPVSVKRMQNHAPYALLFRGKRRDFREFLKGLLRGQLCASADVIQALCWC